MNTARHRLNQVGGVFLLLLMVGLLALAIFRLTAPMFPAASAIAHAGGRIEGRDYTNSLAAFDRAYANGFRILEVDFQQTADGVIVCGHDWVGYTAVPHFTEVVKRRSSDSYAPCTVPELMVWLEGHADMQLMSDAKDDAVAINTMLYSLLGDRLTAQAYSVDQVRQFQELGISRIVLTLYRLGDRSAKFAELDKLISHGLGVEAITMPAVDVLTGTALIVKHRIGLPVFAHTINDCFVSGLLWGLGVDAVYTDDLGPQGCGRSKPVLAETP